MKLRYLNLTPYTKVTHTNSRWIKDINVRIKTMSDQVQRLTPIIPALWEAEAG